MLDVLSVRWLLPRGLPLKFSKACVGISGSCAIRTFAKYSRGLLRFARELLVSLSMQRF